MIVPYKLEKSRRIKRMHLRIECAQFVLLKMPYRQAEHHGMRFLQENGEWICQTLAAQPRVPRLRHYILRYPRLSLSGRWYALEIGYEKGPSQFLIRDRERKVLMRLDPRQGTEDQMRSLLVEIARHYLPSRVAYWSGRTGIRVHGVTIRDQRSRWGSCSETGGISLNWRLVLISPTLQDHVILHELAHLRHFDHSAAFHRYLKALDPQAEVHARQLDGEASRIISLGRSEL